MLRLQPIYYDALCAYFQVIWPILSGATPASPLIVLLPLVPLSSLLGALHAALEAL